ncbi:MAG: hypothetical protein P3B76_06205 [Gemmatimonadota bacterium]|nr:hypothetical protein [Gemmatimonadota bacterium]MDQ8166319.1 hypothetical protein [Gemmatimonadota bacterium]MDQ8172259.1 hypothetical protein [Gemmatimonadota bacterium]
MPFDTTTAMPDTTVPIAPVAAPVAAPRRARRARWIGPLAVLLLLAPTASQTQARRRCPQFARVPGYGACTNIGGANCGFCTYRCNDDTVVRWNVCGQ